MDIVAIFRFLVTGKKKKLLSDLPSRSNKLITLTFAIKSSEGTESSSLVFLKMSVGREAYLSENSS